MPPGDASQNVYILKKNGKFVHKIFKVLQQNLR